MQCIALMETKKKKKKKKKKKNPVHNAFRQNISVWLHEFCLVYRFGKFEVVSCLRRVFP